ncbi:ABC transporter permease [Halobacteria archaeon AArc-m2/3/4]|uniref:ABC transporter permease n=1 Tax=Natronoglomus mannanivorans TaxID=2979990 RepID=A0AAP3E151_9EURY|nr:ABC transporter permease [Halobacteria archaeon AArc-xg1-1]MCU4973624.1 ABC transporter permease [Halobacteria archaeon AArc-m2/3/4]
MTKQTQDPIPDGGYEVGMVGSETTAEAETETETNTNTNTSFVSAAKDGLRQTVVLAETEYRLAVRGRWAIALTAIFAAFALGLTTFSGANVSPDGFDRTVASLAVLAGYLAPLVALAFGYDAIVGREESGWLRALFALPVSRSWIVLGTVLGRGIVLASATVVGFGIAGGFLLWEFGLAGFETYVGFVLATAALGLAFLAIAVLLSTVAREKTHALGLSLLAWAWFVLVHDLLALGVIAAFSLPDAVLSAMLLANPASVFRALVLGSLGAGGDAGFASALADVGLSTVPLVAALLAWAVVPIAVAAIVIRRRRV